MATASELSSTDRRNCETSGFVAAAAPTDNYGIDVHIDTGLLNVGSNWLDSAVQDLLITPIWMGLVWAVHALIVMLEWSFTLDLLPSAAAGELGSGLRQMQATFTEAWLPLALTVASMLALYRGIVRRRVAETLGEALLMAGMMIAALWVIANPQGTVGALGGWANEAALGTLAVAAQGAPSHPSRRFAENLDTVFSTAIEGPWCYLEFGNVSWCREPSRLDLQLRSAGLKTASSELGEIGCSVSLSPSAPCVSAGGEAAKALEHSATMLRFGRTNGAIFLAAPPNGPIRNSINEPTSLLRAICQTSNATSCSGSAAAEAQFRTGSQTWSRLGGLLLILAGSVGMLLLLGFLAMRLLAAALFGLLYLLLAPAMVLAPAFGEGGRALFRKWALGLIGTVVMKLVFSFLLGVILAVAGVIENLPALGWWTQWLLISALWWGAYTRRHHALGLTAGVTGSVAARRSEIGVRIGSLERSRRMISERWAERASKKPAPAVDGPRRTEPVRGQRPPSTDASRGGERAREEGLARTQDLEQRKSQMGGPPERMGGRGSKPESAGAAQEERRENSRASPAEGEAQPRAPHLPAERPRVEVEKDGASGASGARREAQGGDTAPTRRRKEERQTTRDYAALASLAGYSRAQYEHLDPTRRREVQRAIDTELAARQELPGAVKRARPPKPARDAREGLSEEAEGSGGVGRTKQPRRSEGQRSDLMRDARDVEAGRKRQLGPGRP